VTRRLAQALVRRYPAAWRERYEQEVSGLIDDTSIRFGDLAELLRGLLTERARELVSADDRPMRTAATIGFLKVGFVLAFLGSAIGLGLALALGQSFRALLFGIEPVDATSFAGGALALVMVALVAALGPAIRAARVDPVRALRTD